MPKKTFKDSEFRKSSYTGLGGNWACVSVAMRKDAIAVRNTRDKKKTTLVYTPEEWKAFIKGVKDGEFDMK